METKKEYWLNDIPTPWRRYAARIIVDLTLNGFIGFTIIGIVAYAIAPMAADEFFNNLNYLVDLILTVFLSCLITGVMTGLTGSTIGKFIFGLKVKTLDGKNIGISNGLSRDLTVFAKGMWAGVPLLSLVGIYLGYKQLTDTKTTSWDKGQYLVLYRPSGIKQYALNVFGLVLGLSTIAYMRSFY